MSTQASSNTGQVRVWDPLVRLFHWSLVIGFTTAYITGEFESEDLHVLAGYVVLGLVVFRVLWGLIGSRHARFGDFVFRPATVLAYARDQLRGHARRYLGHNPLGGAMVVALLIMLLAVSASGLVLYALEDNAGPLAGVVTRALPVDSDSRPDSGRAPGWDEEMIEEIHEVLSNITLGLVILHVLGVILASLAHRENLVKAMFTGNKRRE